MPGYISEQHNFQPRKEGCVVAIFLDHHFKRGPVNALQMRLQG